MNDRRAELVAVLLTVAGCAVAAVGPFFHEERSVRAAAPPGARIVTLTGIAAVGVWTESDVNAVNYWNESFAPARPVLRAGEPTLLRLKSADVVHSFYCPSLGIGPLEVYPGHVEEVVVIPAAGTHRYYCTTFCSDPHFGMHGEVVVLAGGDAEPPPPALTRDRYWLESRPPAGASRVERGSWLFRRMGCVSCHGPEGQGGVENFNYVKDTVPPLNTLAERLMLFEPEDVEAIVEAIEAGESLESLVDDPPVPRFNVVLAQYNSVREVIRKGNPAGKKDPEGVEPPLEMPSWSERLTTADMESVIAYLLTLQPWEEEQEEDEDEDDEGNMEDEG